MVVPIHATAFAAAWRRLARQISLLAAATRQTQQRQQRRRHLIARSLARIPTATPLRQHCSRPGPSQLSARPVAWRQCHHLRGLGLRRRWREGGRHCCLRSARKPRTSRFEYLCNPLAFLALSTTMCFLTKLIVWTLCQMVCHRACFSCCSQRCCRRKLLRVCSPTLPLPKAPRTPFAFCSSIFSRTFSELCFGVSRACMVVHHNDKDHTACVWWHLRYNQIGMAHQSQGDHDEAIQYFLKALEINEKV